MLTRELLVRLPKAELHVHLDSALRPATMVELARHARFPLPTTDPDALRRFMLVDDAGSLEDYLARFEYTIPLLQTAEGVERVAYEMVEDAARDGLRYLEVRYCPRLSTRGGLTMARRSRRSSAASRGASTTSASSTRVINCSLRHYAPEVSWRSRGCRWPIATAAWWRSTSRAARRAGRPACTRRRSTSRRTAASASRSTRARPPAAASIAEAVHRCHADRIGHGTRLYEDPVLRDYIRDRRLLIETNITSNLQTRAVRGRRGAPGARVLRCGAGGHAVYRRLADDRRVAVATSTGWPTPSSASPARRSIG